MTERLRTGGSSGPNSAQKMENDLGPRKTMIVLVIVVGCFAILWPKVFYPMLQGSATQHIKPSPIDKTTGCCDVISESDFKTIKIMSELCANIIQNETADGGRPLVGNALIQTCRKQVLETCGIDIAAVLQEQVRLGQNVRQILDEIRSLNGSLCLKYNFGVAPWQLGVPHRITVRAPADNIKQERPMQLRSELLHPAFRERGRAIIQPHIVPQAPPEAAPRIVEGRPGPIPGMRPTIGGAGHVVPPPKQATSSMSIIMPLYTIGIVVFFTYTLVKIIFKKQPESAGGALYPPVEPDQNFRKEVFESEQCRLAPKMTRENVSTKLVVNAMSALLDEVDQEIEQRRKIGEVAATAQDLANGSLSNGRAHKPEEVRVLGMEMTASCENGVKWARQEAPVAAAAPPPPEPRPPPQEIFLEGALPAQSHLLVAESATEAEEGDEGEDPAVVLSGKMTLSVISADAADENGTSPLQEEEIEEQLVDLNENVEIEEIEEPKPQLMETKNVNFSFSIESPDEASVRVEDLEKEVDALIEEALQLAKEQETVPNNEANEDDIVIEDKKPNDEDETQKTVAFTEAAKDEDVEEEEEIEEDEEEVEYEEETEEEIEVEESEEEEEEEAPSGKLNGKHDAKYSASEATAAENDISEEEVTDDEEIDNDEEDEEVVVIEELEEEEEDGELEVNNVGINNVSDKSDED